MKRRQERMKFYKRSDVVIISIILLISLFLWIIYGYLTADRVVRAEIYYYSELLETIVLDGAGEHTISIPQNPNVILKIYKEGSIAFVASDCPDQVCVNTGKIHRVGEYAACLPNGIVLKIVPEGERDDDDADIIVGN